MKCDVNCKYYHMCWNIGEGTCEIGEDCDQYKPEPPKVAFLCKDKGTEYCHHTSHIDQARNFEKIGPNVWAETERITTFELYEDKDFSGGGYILCTACGWKFSFGAYHILEHDKYCPHCGSKVKHQTYLDALTLTFTRVEEGDEHDGT